MEYLWQLECHSGLAMALSGTWWENTSQTRHRCRDGERAAVRLRETSSLHHTNERIFFHFVSACHRVEALHSRAVTLVTRHCGASYWHRPGWHYKPLFFGIFLRWYVICAHFKKWFFLKFLIGSSSSINSISTIFV